eukprot:gene13215-biopygen2264
MRGHPHPHYRLSADDTDAHKAVASRSGVRSALLLRRRQQQQQRRQRQQRQQRQQQQGAATAADVSSLHGQPLISTRQPDCADFQRGLCQRGSKCRYRPRTELDGTAPANREIYSNTDNCLKNRVSIVWGPSGSARTVIRLEHSEHPTSHQMPSCHHVKDPAIPHIGSADRMGCHR